ncbi:coiled-coil domain-containing protein 124-like isoform X2 [Ornithodoros turicata]|uniref:coiled-coil domain-containing protein 124-like isoform X2 n=1 Tax=Ornithodoros turicata TaxID=34597 RepID=UPI0031390179
MRLDTHVQNRKTMPKKFGTNTKSADARAKKEAKKEAEKSLKERAAEDALWADDDKHITRKQQRKDEREKKKSELFEKKAALKQMYDEEMNSIKSAKARVEKVTRADIAAMAEKHKPAKKEEELLHHEKPLEENVNRIVVEGDEARSVQDAIAILSTSDIDRHPERRVKAAYEAYESRRLPELKAENPNLRLSQLKHMIRKDWLKSPDNPLNNL